MGARKKGARRVKDARKEGCKGNRVQRINDARKQGAKDKACKEKGSLG